MPIDQLILLALRDEMSRLLPEKRCYYHYNANAVIKGPILYFNWCTDYDHHWKNLRDNEVQIILFDGKILVTKDPQPSRVPTNVIACFDLAAPSFCAGDLSRALRKYYDRPKDGSAARRPLAARR